MEAKDLMIGDLIKTNSTSWSEDLKDKYCKVTFLAKNYVSSISVDDSQKKPYGEGNSFEPIPLTPEILERNQFIKFAGQYVIKADKEPFIHLISLGNMPNANGSMLVAIKDRYTNAKIAITYVHELQHALRLCGIEKEIEL